MAGPLNPDVEWAIGDIRAHLKARQEALDYYEGRHPLNFVNAKSTSHFREMFQELHDNLCDDVVDEAVDRLQIDGWTGTAATTAEEWWDSPAARGPARAGAIHLDATRSGDAFAIVWDVNGDGVPRLYVQDPRQMAVRYSTTDPDRQEVAAKCWRVGKGYRLTLYYGPQGNERGRIERYASKGSSTSGDGGGIPNAAAFAPYTEGDPADPETFADWLEYHDQDRSPVFHFPNGESGRYGKSALAGVIPLQRAYNKLLCDFMVASEGAAKPKRWGTGIEIPTDPVTGRELPAFKEEDGLWWTKAKEADFGDFKTADVAAMLLGLDAIALKIARAGSLPPWAISLSDGSAGASGLSRLLLEGKLVKRLKDRHRDWGTEWRELVAFALSFNGGKVAPGDLEPTWAPVETRDETAELERLALKKGVVGSVVPDAQFAREAGYDDKELKAFIAEKEQETTEKMDRQQAMLGGRISTPGNLPAVPVQPNGAGAPAIPGARS